MATYKAHVSLELEVWVHRADNNEEVVEHLENMELPKGYREDTFKIEFIEKYKD